jgi:hypothetical protein
MQIAPNRWSCSLAAFAMALNTPLQKLIEELGHDGSQIVFPDLPEPYCRRAFHIQEFIKPCHDRGFAMVVVEVCPVLAGSRNHCYELFGEDRFYWFLAHYNGVVVGMINGHMHACAWDQKDCYDPAGYKHGFENYAIREFAALIPMQSQS